MFNRDEALVHWGQHALSLFLQGIDLVYVTPDGANYSVEERLEGSITDKALPSHGEQDNESIPHRQPIHHDSILDQQETPIDPSHQFASLVSEMKKEPDEDGVDEDGVDEDEEDPGVAEAPKLSLSLQQLTARMHSNSWKISSVSELEQPVSYTHLTLPTILRV